MIKRNLLMFVLFGVMVTSCKTNNTCCNDLTTCGAKKDSLTSVKSISTENNNSNTVVYVNIDSLHKNYKYYTDAKSQLEARNISRTKQFDAKTTAFRLEVENAKRASAGMTEFQQQELMTALQKKDHDLQELQQTLKVQSIEDEANENKKLFKKINTYLAKFSKENGIKMVIQHSENSGIVLFADTSLDYTGKIIDGLNSEYKSEAKK